MYIQACMQREESVFLELLSHTDRQESNHGGKCEDDWQDRYDHRDVTDAKEILHTQKDVASKDKKQKRNSNVY